jgi:hypothetical protein
MSDYPPKPRLTLRVGITGHRPKPHRYPLGSIDRVKDQLHSVFAAIDAVLMAHAQSADLYSAEPHQVRLVSGLAEGADQLAVSARPPNWTVDAILPFPRASYLKDFETSAMEDGRDVRPEFQAVLAQAQTVVELPEESGAREAAYARLGAFLLRQIDILVAVWDGGPSEGVGSTADVVKKAGEAGIPIVWVSSSEDIFPRLIDEVEEDGQPVAPLADCTRGGLREVISSIVSAPTGAPPHPDPDHSPEPDAAQQLTQFLGEKWPLRCRWVAYDIFKRLVEGEPVRSFIPFKALQDSAGDWNQFVADAPPVGDLGTRIIVMVKPRYVWADTLAVYLANVYRSTYIIVYLLSAFAVALALGGVFSHLFDDNNFNNRAFAFKGTLVFLELILIFVIIRIVTIGRQERWHQRFLEYRTLAEMLRDIRFLAYVGENGRILRTSELGPAPWFLWYLRATIRELGLPNAVLDGTYQRAHLATVEGQAIESQIDYHRRNAMTLDKMDYVIHWVGDACFYATGCVLAVYLGGLLALLLFENLRNLLQDSRDVVTYVAAWFPALGGALAGIRETGDFAGSAALSAKTASALEDLKRDYAEAKRSLSLADTGDVLIATAQVMTQDLTAWRSIYGRKRLTLPA